MAGTVGAQTVTAPTLTPPVNGLLQAATVIDHDDGDSKWLNGITFSPDHNGDARVIDPSCNTADDSTEITRGNERPAPLTFKPFYIDVDDNCDTFGFATSDYEGRVRRLISARETKAVEREFWTGGKVAGNFHLADNTADAVDTPAGTTAIGIKAALASANQAIGDFNLGRGMIHLRPYLFSLAAAADLFRYESGKWYTATGAIVVPGTGYPGTSPSGAAATGTAEWLYATALVEVERGQVVIPSNGFAQTVDRVHNTVQVIGERPYLYRVATDTIVGIPVNPTVA